MILYLKYALVVVLFLSSVLSCLFLMGRARQGFSSFFTRILYRSRMNERERHKELEAIRQQEGYAEEAGYMMKLDERLEYSGIRRRLPFLNAESYLVVMFVAAATLFIIIGIAMKKPVIGALSVAGLVGGSRLVQLLLIIYSKRRTENSIITFINLMENYAKTSTDIVDIMGKIWPFLKEPLRTQVRECYLDAERTGSTVGALERFAAHVNHNKLKFVIRNFAICTRYEANYEEVIKDARASIQAYLRYSAERKALIGDARMEITILFGMGAAIIWAMGYFMETELLPLLIENIAGRVIFGYLALIVVLVTIMFLKAEKND